MAKTTFSELRNKLKAALSRVEELSREVDLLKAERIKADELALKLSELQSDDDLWEKVKDNSEVKNRVIGEYLGSLMRGGVSLIGGSGYTPLTPVSKPKTLADAKRIADKIIKS